MSFLKIMALMCEAYRRYESLTRAEILKILILIEYLNSEWLNKFSWTRIVDTFRTTEPKAHFEEVFEFQISQTLFNLKNTDCCVFFIECLYYYYNFSQKNIG